ncbi:MAG TPA: hypothetical protein DD641_04855 [Deltaproteobacteria bacterium]|nr:hypothetical protein [Deltaproteobacteria bacterium]
MTYHKSHSPSLSKYSSTLFLLPAALTKEEKLKGISAELGTLTGYRVMTFPELISVLSSVGIAHPARVVSSTGELLLVKGAVDSALKDNVGTSILYSMRHSPLLYRSINKFIRELRQALIASEDFDKAVKPLKNEKYDFLSSVYSIYDRSLSSLNLTDSIGREWAVLKEFEKESGLPSFISGIEKLVIEGFYDLTAVQRSIVRGMITKGISLKIIPVYSLENPDATRAAEGLLNFFETMEDLSPDSIIFTHSAEGGGHPVERGDTSINYLMRNFLRVSEPYDFIRDDNVNLVAAPGRYREIEEVGRETRRLFSAGVNPADIGVVFRDIAPYGEIVEDVFRRFNIPLYFRRGTPLLASPIIKNILSVYDIIESGFERERVLKLLNSDYVDYSSFAGEKGIDFDTIERIAADAKIISEDVEGWGNAIERYIRQKKGDAGAEMAVKCLVSNFIKTLKGIDKKQTFKGHKAALYKVIEKLSIDRVKDREDMFDLERREILSLDVFKEAMDEIETAFKDIGRDRAVLSMEEFRGIVLEHLREKNVPSHRDRRGIKVLSIMDARGLKFKYLFICGLNDGEFPANEAPHPFIREDDKMRLNMAFHKRIFLTNKAKWWEEPLLFMLSLGMAEKKTYLSYSYLDEKGRETIPSIFFREAIRVLGESAPLKKIPVSDVVAKLPEALEKDELLIGICKALSDTKTHDRHYAEELLELIDNKADNNKEGFKGNVLRLKKVCNVEKIRESAAGDDLRWSGGIADNDLKVRLKNEFLGGNNITWNATMLETLAKCPFYFYMKNVLRLDELAEADIEIDSLTEGAIVHVILERFYREAQKMGLLPCKGAAEEIGLLEKTMAGVFADVEDKYFVGNKELWVLRKEQMSAMMERFYRLEAGLDDKEFLPRYFEVRFGQGEDIPPLKITLTGGDVIYINGKIDRIDASTDGIRVIDYKTGFVPDNKDIGKIYFQIPLYILAAAGSSSLHEKQYSRFMGFYYSIRKAECREVTDIKDDNGNILLDEYIFGSRNGAESLSPHVSSGKKRTMQGDIDRLMLHIRSGNFRAEPHDKKDCENCKFWSICRYIPSRGEG